MEGPAQHTPLGQMEGEIAVHLLKEALRSDHAISTPGLQLLFERAGSMPLAKDLRQISTERLLLAITTLGEDGYDLPRHEQHALTEVGALIRRHETVLESLHEKIERDPLASVRGTPPEAPVDLSNNVRRALAMAVKFATNRQVSEATRIVNVAEFLAVFPPVGSKAANLLKRGGVNRFEWDAIVREFLSEGPNAPAPESTAAPEPVSAREKDPPQMPAKAPRARTKKAPARTRPAINERVFTHSDEPATDDLLGRKPFAEVLAGRIREARRSGGKDVPPAFVAHLHGPWGSGKSSVLNFLEKLLSEGDDPWLVVRFDAWRSQRLQPPWWSLITTIYSAARKSLNWRKALKLRIWWLVWRIRADYVPLIAVAACAIALLLLVIWVGAPGAAADATARSGAEEQFANWLDKLLKLIAGGITIVGAIVLWSRSLAMGSQRAAQAYADLKTDPYGPIAKLFNRLIKAIDQPVVVFVDDLDRCESKYVVDLLEGIQTLMRGAAVSYVVAGDRKWICSSFEQRYGAFSPPIGEPGRPLGYLFLDKIFQISAAIPQPGAEAQLLYWNRLLDPESRPSPPEERRAAEAKADAEAAQLTRQEDLQKMVDDAEESGDQATIQAARGAAAKRIASQPAATETEHRLRRYVDMLEPNPRAMKRLVNAYGMHQATLFLAGRSCPPDALARWTILELRWPLLADFLANRPGCVRLLHGALDDKEFPQVPDQLRDLFGDELVNAVIGPKRGANRLSETAIRAILGAAQGER